MSRTPRVRASRLKRMIGSLQVFRRSSSVCLGLSFSLPVYANALTTRDRRGRRKLALSSACMRLCAAGAALFLGVGAGIASVHAANPVSGQSCSDANGGGISKLGVDRLPASIQNSGAQSNSTGKRAWTIADLVQIRRITDIEVSHDDRSIAFILKQSFVDSADIRYGLYVVDHDARQPARKLVESAYMSDLSPIGRTNSWVVRADFGSGVQLYEVDIQGAVKPLIVSPTTSLVGGYHGVVMSATEGARCTGVLAYGWAPDDSALWYSRVRLRTERAATIDRGIAYDSGAMASTVFSSDISGFEGTELVVRDLSTSHERVVAFVPTNRIIDPYELRGSSVVWEEDSQHIRYLTTKIKPRGEQEFQVWRVHVGTSEHRQITQPNAVESFASRSLPDGNGVLTLQASGPRMRLVQVTSSGEVIKDFGEVGYRRINRVWVSPSDGTVILHVSYRDRDTVVALTGALKLPGVAENLGDCVFSSDIEYGVCVRESLALAPELVVIHPRAGRFAVLSRPNAHYDDIEPLRSKRQEWHNRFGSVSDGYITYPRDYVQGRKYPVILVTHGGDARNLFAFEGFQAEFPVQVFAEAGYFVVSVNDPHVSERTRASHEAWTKSASTDSEQMQFSSGLDAVAGAEAALQSLIERGEGDPEKTGIAGYSRGSEVVEYAMVHSRMFKVASEGDAGGWNPGVYWAWGTSIFRAIMNSLYGGSPYEEKALRSYREFSPVFRAREFSGPLLQQFAGATSLFGLELNSELRDASIPAELVFYPDETHVFWHPHDRYAAMDRNLDWFNYWLLGKRDMSASKESRYRRWDAMARSWKEAKGLRAGS